MRTSSKGNKSPELPISFLMLLFYHKTCLQDKRIYIGAMKVLAAHRHGLKTLILNPLDLLAKLPIIST